MKTRRVGGTALEVTELGFGTATFGGQLGTIVDDDQGRATLGAAIAAGIGYFDTAPMYGFGRSERVLGDSLRFRQDGKIISTKVGRLLQALPHESEREQPQPWTQPYPFEPIYDYSYRGIMRSFEDSLQRLGLGRVDILLVHDIGTQTHGIEGNKAHWAQLAEGGYRALSELKAKGLISAIGLGVNEWPVLMDALELGDWDAFLLANRYTLLEQEALHPLLDACIRRGTSLIAAGPFAGGILAGTDVWGPPNGVYAATPPEVMARVRSLQELARQHRIPLGAAALQFALAHPAVCTVLTGPKSVDELDGILKWWNTPVPSGFWDALADDKLVAAGTPLPNGRTA
ncbi:MAG: aldo/keto reductase [Devosia sp.]